MPNKILTPDQIDKICENEYLGLNRYFDDSNIYNIFMDTNHKNIFNNNPVLELLDIMSNPDYFYYTCKWLFNVKLLPFQVAILKQLWIKKFPMFIASRGGSKCITKNSIICSDKGIFKISDFIDESYNILTKYPINIKLFGENCFSNVEYMFSNGITDTIKIKTKCGFELEGTKDHPIRVLNKENIIWKNLGDITTNEIVIIDRTENQFGNNVENKLEIDEAYLLGLIVGDGGYTKKGNISFTTNDKELSDNIIKYSTKYFGKPFKRQCSSKYGWLVCGIDIWNRLFSYYGFNSSECGKKEVPTSILRGNKNIIKAFIQGMFDTDGWCDKIGKIGFCSKSIEMARMLQFLLTKFGIIGVLRKQLNKKYQKYYYKIEIYGENAIKFGKNIGFRLGRKQKRIEKYYNRKINTNNDVIPSSFLINRIIRIKQQYFPTKKRGTGCTPKNDITIWRLNTYDLSYNKLYEIIKFYENNGVPSDNEDLKFIKDIYSKHYFFDKIQKVESSQNYTFDFHIPNDHSFISNGFISHNTWLLAIYAMLRAIFTHNAKIIIVAAGFRQAKFMFEYMENIWRNSPILRQIVGQGKKEGPRRDIDRCNFYIGDSEIIAIPLGDGQKIRGLRSNYTLVDEFHAISQEIYEVVIKGFSSVSSAPEEKVSNISRIKTLKSLGMFNEAENLEENLGFGNQIIISGTAYYHFNHFYEYWQRYKKIIESKGDVSKLQEIFKGEIPEGFDWTQYAIIRLPYNLLPEGFMDVQQIYQAKATNTNLSYIMEYGAVFSSDSNGFFKRSLVESCVTKNPINLPSGPVTFSASISGNKKCKYVYGIDPASEADNFAITVLECHPDHRRIVYVWSITRSKMRERLNRMDAGQDHSFYNYCARKIRDLMKVFPTEHIGIDSQGGGVAVMEALHDKTQLEHAELPLWPYIKKTYDNFWWEKEDKPTDREPGFHYLHMINFASAEFTNESNHGMRKDFESKSLLFPFFDSVTIAESIELDKLQKRTYDTLEDCCLDIEELKDELATIIHDQTLSGRDRWSTPEIKLPGNKKGRLRKDRYTSLLIANMIARTLSFEDKTPDYNCIGTYVGNKKGDKNNISPMYSGRPDITNKLNSFHGKIVKRIGIGV